MKYLYDKGSKIAPDSKQGVCAPTPILNQEYPY